MYRIIYNAFCIALFLSPTASYSDSWETKLTGKVDVQSGFEALSSSENKETKKILSGEVTPKFKIFKKIHDNELGIATKLDINTNASRYMNRNLIDQYSIFFDSIKGKYAFGKSFGVGHILQTGPAILSQSDDFHPINYSLLLSINDSLLADLQDNHDAIIARPGLWSEQPYLREKDSAVEFFDKRQNAVKGTYISLPLNNFRLGLSYIPEITHRLHDHESKSGFRNIAQTGLFFAEQFGNIALKTSLVGEYGSATNDLMYDLKAWEYGINTAYMGFELSVSYGNWGKSGFLKSDLSAKRTSDYWATGLAYSISHISAKAIWFNSTKRLTTNQSNDISDITLEMDYRIMSALTVYMQSSWHKLKKNSKNEALHVTRGQTFLFGARCVF